MRLPRPLTLWLPLLVAGLACISSIGPALKPRSDPPTPEPTFLPTQTLLPILPPTPTQTYWVELVPGIERLNMSLPVYTDETTIEVPVTIVRLNPTQVDIRVHYTREAPATLGEWRSRLPEAEVIVNGGFYNEDDRAIGVVVADGQRYGIPVFTTWGGLFSVTGSQADVRSLAQFPYNPSEPLDQAIEGYPMLLYPGALPVSFDADVTAVSRRTAVATDREGRLLIFVVDLPGVTLGNLRGWLEAAADRLSLYAALNLDGGRSTGLVVRAWEEDTLIDSWEPVPVVIAVYAR